MLIEHRGVRPRVATTAYVAPTAVVCGDVEIGEECRVMFGAVLVAEDAPVRVAGRTVIMENAIVRAWPQLPVELGHDVMIGPGANVNGAQIDDDAFVAASATIFRQRTSASARSCAPTASCTSTRSCRRPRRPRRLDRDRQTRRDRAARTG